MGKTMFIPSVALGGVIQLARCLTITYISHYFTLDMCHLFLVIFTESVFLSSEFVSTVF